MSSRTDGRAAGRKIRDDSTELNPKPRNKKAKAPSKPPPPRPEPQKHVYFSLYQTMLNVFSAAFPAILASNSLQPTLQEVKGHLFRREFDDAFGTTDRCHAYAARWSASRALAYVELFLEAIDELRAPNSDAVDGPAGLSSALQGVSLSNGHAACKRHPSEKINVVCLGGGAGAELCALAAVHKVLRERVSKTEPKAPLKSHHDNTRDTEPTSGTKDTANTGDIHSNSNPDDNDETSNDSLDENIASIDITLVDIADWSSVLTSLTSALTTPPPISPYASAAAKAAAVHPLIPPASLHTTFLQHDLLSATSNPPERSTDKSTDNLSDDSADRSANQVTPPAATPTSNPLQAHLPSASLVTLAFTLNELYAASIPRTQALLLALTASLRPGALLLVIDSAGSYSAVGVGAVERRYPMSWLLEHCLLRVAGGDGKKEGVAMKTAGGAEKKTRRVDGDGTKAGGVGGNQKKAWELVRSEESRWFRLPAGLKYPIDLENMRFQTALYRRV